MNRISNSSNEIKNLKKIAIVSFLFFTAFIYNVLFCNYFSGLLDEGFTVNVITRILNGEIPYKDFYCLITPGSYYLGALVYGCFGHSIISLRILTCVCAACFSIVAYEFVLKITNKKICALITFICVTVCGLSMSTTMPYTIYAYDSNLFAVISVLFFLLYILKEDKKCYSFLAAIFLVVSFLFKQTVCLYYVLGYLVCSFIIIYFYKEKRKDYLCFLKYFLGIILVGAILFWGFFIVTHSVSDMIHNLLTIPIMEFGAAKVSPPTVSELFLPKVNRSYAPTIMYYLEILMMILPTFFLIILKKKEKRGNILLIAILLIFSICEFNLNLERFSFIKIVSTWPMICIMFAVFCSFDSIRKSIKIFFGLLSLLLITFAINVKFIYSLELIKSHKYYFPNTCLLTTEDTYDKYDSLFNKLDELSITNDDVLIYPMSPLIYSLKDLSNPTRQDLIILGNFDNKGLNEIISILETENTNYLVFDNYSDMDGQKFSDYAKQLNDYILEHYHVIWSYDEHLEIFERN